MPPALTITCSIGSSELVGYFAKIGENADVCTDYSGSLRYR